MWEALLDAHPSVSAADKLAIARQNAVQPFTVTRGKPGEGQVQIEIDTQRHYIAVRGEWWYRGVMPVAPHAQGSLLVYNVYNIAPGAGWWMAQLIQGPSHARTMREIHLQPLLRAIGEMRSAAPITVKPSAEMSKRIPPKAINPQPTSNDQCL